MVMLDKPTPTAIAVLDHFGVKYRRAGAELRTHLCPSCGQRARDSVCFNASTGQWRCHAHGCDGDIFKAIADYSGQRDVDRRTFDLARTIAGESPPMPTPIFIDAKPPIDMAATWAALERRSLVGERYLSSRGLDSAELRARGDIVRFSASGEIAVAAHDLDTNTIVGIQYRASAGKGFRTERGSRLTGAALTGRIAELGPDGVDVAVLVEGVADALAARLAFPGCAVFGAPGCQQMTRVAASLALRLYGSGWLMIVPDDDDEGVEAAVSAIRAAQACGLELDDDLRLVDLGVHHDLAEAWQAGWRWQWPNETGRAS